MPLATPDPAPSECRSRPRSIFWRALGATFVLHAGLLLLEFGDRDPVGSRPAPTIEVELTDRAPAREARVGQHSTPARVPTAIPPPAVTAPASPAAGPTVPERVTAVGALPAPAREQAESPRVLRSRILASPWLEDADPAAGIFGPPREAPEPGADYHLPQRADFYAVLDYHPLPDLPFEDPGLVDFMYAPGAMGSMHRGFDAITPEFGFTTNTGFTVRCRWVLVVVGCAWGRSL